MKCKSKRCEENWKYKNRRKKNNGYGKWINFLNCYAKRIILLYIFEYIVGVC